MESSIKRRKYSKKSSRPGRAVSGKYKRRGASSRVYKQRRALAALANPATMGFLGIEKKYYDTWVQGRLIVTTPDATGMEMGVRSGSAAGFNPATQTGGTSTLVHTLSAPAQGDSASDRDGRTIRLTSCYVKGVIHKKFITTETNPSYGNVVWVALVLDTQTNGAVLNSEDVYGNPSGSSIMAGAMTRNLKWSQRFKVIREGVFSMGTGVLAWQDGTGFAESGITKTFEWYIPLDIQVNFKDATGEGTANVMDNSLYLLATSATTDTPQCEFFANCRVRFLG